MRLSDGQRGCAGGGRRGRARVGEYRVVLVTAHSHRRVVDGQRSAGRERYITEADSAVSAHLPLDGRCRTAAGGGGKADVGDSVGHPLAYWLGGDAGRAARRVDVKRVAYPGRFWDGPGARRGDVEIAGIRNGHVLRENAQCERRTGERSTRERASRGEGHLVAAAVERSHPVTEGVLGRNGDGEGRSRRLRAKNRVEVEVVHRPGDDRENTAQCRGQTGRASRRQL